MLIALFAGCGKHADSTGGKKDSGPTGPTAAPIAMPSIGVDRVGRFNFVYGDGEGAYDKATAALKKRDWAAVKSACEAALAKDAWHLDAHWLLATALSQTGDAAGAADHVTTAISADYYKYGPLLATDPELDKLRATPHGQALAQLAQQIHDEYGKRVKNALWLVGRRSTFKWPAKDGVQTATSRGELYAYDRETKRFFRLTHTEHQVAGFVTAGNEVALLGFDKIDRGKGDETPALLQRPWIQVVDTAEWKPSGARITLPPSREVDLGYATGDQLLVATAAAQGRWGTLPPEVSSVDRTTGKLTKVGAQPPVPRIAFTLDDGRLVRAPQGVEAAWTGDPPTAPTLKAGGATIQVPESGQTSASSVALAPGGGKLAFATAVDPCAKDVAPSLYVADAKTGALKHLLTARSRFATRWLDPTTLAYEDGEGAIRLWDAASQRETMRLDERGGLALDVLSLAAAPLCKQAPPTAEPAGSGEEPLPPEEGSGGPVTAPQ